MVLVRTWTGNLHAFTKDTSARWRVNDYICLRRPPDRSTPPGEKMPFVACGQIIRITRRGMIVHMAGAGQRLRLAERFDPELVDADTYYASGLVDETYIDPRPPFDQRAISLGVTYLEPLVHFEQGLTRHITLGIMPSFFSMAVGAGHIEGGAYVFSGNYYGNRPYDGAWVNVTLGYSFYTATVGYDQERKGTPVASLSVGWKVLLGRRFTAGATIGGQYFFSTKFSYFDIKWGGLLPVAMIQLGLKF